MIGPLEQKLESGQDLFTDDNDDDDDNDNDNDDNNDDMIIT